MSDIQITLPGASYPIRIQNGYLQRAGQLCEAEISEKNVRALLVTNDTVGPLYGQMTRESLKAAGFSVFEHQVPDGEKFKNYETIQGIYQACLASGLDRSSLIVSLGGGVVGDMAGFVAGTFMRGLPLVHIPTSLLAMVDASVGGKTGYDLPEGKNLVGAFKQPRLVLIDPEVLGTLPERELACGMAEAIKHGIIGDEKLFKSLETDDWRDLPLLIRDAVEVKARIVEADETEAGVRAFLNLGHTFGHAFELVSGFTVPHGEAVGVGLIAATILGERLGRTDSTLLERLENVLAKHRLPLKLGGLDADAVVTAMRHDKKKRGSLRFVVPVRLGKVEIVHGPPEETVREAVARVISTPQSP